MKEECVNLKVRLDSRLVVWIFFVVAFFGYIIIGLQPVEAVSYEVSGKLFIPSISLDTDVTALNLEEHQLKTPGDIIGSFTRKNKTLLIGHADTVFKNLEKVKSGDEIFYDDAKYQVSDMYMKNKSDINIDELMSSVNDDELIIMTCAGNSVNEFDSTHRLIIIAESNV